MQWPKEEKDGKANNDLQDTSKKTKDRATRIPPKTASKLVCSGRVGSSCCTNGNFIFTICGLKTISPNVVLYCFSYIWFQLNFMLKEEENIEVNLPDLIPFTIYTITVRSRSPEAKGDQYWSNPVTRNYTTEAAGIES